MPRLRFSLAVALSLTAAAAQADDAGSRLGDAGTKAATAGDAGAKTGGDDAGTKPAKPSGGENPHAGHGHGGASDANIPGMFTPPPDTVEEDAALPPGTLEATILDPDDLPIPNAQAIVGVLHNSVAKGESRSQLVRTADAAGVVRLDGQETGMGIAYRVSVSQGGGTFGSTPFRLGAAKGMRVRLHVYPVTHNLSELPLLVTQYTVAVELKDDRIQLQSLLQVYNLGRVAWVPGDVVVSLPEGFTAFRANDDMSDRGVDQVEKTGARMRGTFGPGQFEIPFQWQLPYSGEGTVSFEPGLPPHLAGARVVAQASQNMTLDAAGFPKPEQRFGNEGERLLITERQMRRDEGTNRVKITLGNLPTQGPGRDVAAFLTAAIVLGGFGLAFSHKGPWKAKKELDKLERAQLLEELEELERAHRAGEIGPKTYERARRELIDALARTLSKGAR